jgi:hypothetical protein
LDSPGLSLAAAQERQAAVERDIEETGEHPSSIAAAMRHQRAVELELAEEAAGVTAARTEVDDDDEW